jgi:quercetin 2,3-dioxygenase
MGVVLYGGSHRFRTTEPDRTTRHSFSFGPHYDPANLGFGPLVAHNDDLVSPAGGYPDHPHRDLEIVTWVIDGALLHTDSLGHRSVLGPGTLQVQSAGSGIRHAEIADPGSGPTRFVQAWLRPDEPGLPPKRRLASDPGLAGAGLVPVVGGPSADGAALPLGVAGAGLLAGGQPPARRSGSRRDRGSTSSSPRAPSSCRTWKAARTAGRARPSRPARRAAAWPGSPRAGRAMRGGSRTAPG